MDACTRFLPRSALAAALGGLLVTMPQHAAAQVAASKPVNADAIAACERAARQSLAPQAAHPPEVTFTTSAPAEPAMPGDSQLMLRGAGRWRAGEGLRSFNYNCTVDLRSGEAVGLVMRDLTPPAPAPARALVEPDLSHLSPAACESSAAAALKQRWPRVSQISFDSGTRSLVQDSASRAELHGQGRALPTPDAPSTHFGFDCELDPRDGRVIATRISG